MEAITLRREHGHGRVPARPALEVELMARLRPLLELLTDEELERIGADDGPRVFWLLGGDGLPVSGVIYDPETDRRTPFRLPIAGRVVA